MISTLTITVPATDTTLLTTAELRSATGVTGSGSDAALALLGAKIAASITSECNIAVGDGAEPTLRRETMTQTIYECWLQEIILARRHNVTITSIVEDDVTLTAADYVVKGESGIIYRMSGNYRIAWAAGKVVITYAAGFDTVPADLKQAASDFVRLAWSEASRDPALKSRNVDIFEVQKTEEQFWVGSVPGQSSEGAVPSVVAGQLKRFLNYPIG